MEIKSEIVLVEGRELWCDTMSENIDNITINTRGDLDQISETRTLDPTFMLRSLISKLDGALGMLGGGFIKNVRQGTIKSIPDRKTTGLDPGKSCIFSSGALKAYSAVFFEGYVST